MQVINSRTVQVVDVLSIAPGQCFEHNGITFVRIVEIETAHISDGVSLRYIVGIDLMYGNFFCVPDFVQSNSEQRLVTPVFAHVQITDAPYRETVLNIGNVICGRAPVKVYPVTVDEKYR